MGLVIVMEKTEYTVFCSTWMKRYTKSFDQLSKAKKFYDRSCAKWKEVYMAKYRYVLNDAGTAWFAENMQYLYYNNQDAPTIMKQTAEYRNIVKK